MISFLNRWTPCVKRMRFRLELLQKQFVGGEQANNAALKEKRLRKKKDAEKKIERLAGQN